MVEDEKILQLKISLQGIKPEIWRRFLVSNDVSFYDLHQIIQKVMGWDNYHMYDFKVDDNYIEADKVDGLCVDSMWTSFMPKRKALPASKTRIGSIIVNEKEKFFYVYDFGDSWLHSLVVEKILSDEEVQQHPFCIDGERACPPEDCGGVYGYKELMKIRKNKNHPEYEERIVEWLGEDYDMDLFVVDLVNAKLKGKKPIPLWVKSKVNQNNCTHDFMHLIKKKKYDVFKCKKCEFINKVWKM